MIKSSFYILPSVYVRMYVCMYLCMYDVYLDINNKGAAPVVEHSPPGYERRLRPQRYTHSKALICAANRERFIGWDD